MTSKYGTLGAHDSIHNQECIVSFICLIHPDDDDKDTGCRDVHDAVACNGDVDEIGDTDANKDDNEQMNNRMSMFKRKLILVSSILMQEKI